MREPNTRDRGSFEVPRSRVARRGFEPLTSSLKGKRPRPLGDRAAPAFKDNERYSLTDWIRKMSSHVLKTPHNRLRIAIPALR